MCSDSFVTAAIEIPHRRPRGRIPKGNTEPVRL